MTPAALHGTIVSCTDKGASKQNTSIAFMQWLLVFDTKIFSTVSSYMRKQAAQYGCCVKLCTQWRQRAHARAVAAVNCLVDMGLIRGRTVLLCRAAAADPC